MTSVDGKGEEKTPGLMGLKNAQCHWEQTISACSSLMRQISIVKHNEEACKTAFDGKH